MKSVTDLNQSVELFTIRKMAVAMYRILTVGSFDIIYKDNDMTEEEQKIVVYKMQTRTLAYVQKVTGMEWRDLQSICQMSQEHCQQLIAALAPVTAEDIRSWWHTDGRDEFYAEREARKERERIEAIATVYRVDDKGFAHMRADGTVEVVKTPACATGWDHSCNKPKVYASLALQFAVVRAITIHKDKVGLLVSEATC